MEFVGFDWDAGNSGKCLKHGVSLAEIEHLFSKPVLILDDVANSERERRFRAIGRGASGRFVFVVFTLREGFLRALSARYMHRKEVRRYEKDNSELRNR